MDPFYFLVLGVLAAYTAGVVSTFWLVSVVGSSIRWPERAPSSQLDADLAEKSALIDQLSGDLQWARQELARSQSKASAASASGRY